MQKKLDKIFSLVSNKKYSEALIKINKLISKSKDPNLLINRAVIYIFLSQYTYAIKDLNNYLTLDPTSTEALCNLGLCLKETNKYQEAIAIFIKSINSNPSYLPSYLNLAETYINLYLYHDAINILNKSLDINNSIEKIFQLLATCHKEMNDYNKFRFFIQKAISLNPYNPENFFQLAFSFIWENNFSAAINNFKESLRLNPNHTPSLYYINQIEKNTTSSSNFFLELIKLNKKNLSRADLGYLHLTISDCYYNEEKFDLCLEHLHKANSYRHSNIEKSFNINLTDIKKLFYQFDNLDLYSSSSPAKPIFILGMPRSGSSLVEQVLSSNEDVYAAGEVPIIHGYIMRFLNSNSTDLVNYFNNLTYVYFNHINHLTQKHFFIDKLPLNFLWIGIIKKLMPTATFILTTRNKLDIFNSLYRTFFSEGILEFAYDIKSINNFYKLYEACISFWRSVNIEIIEICYDDIIKNPEAEFSKLFNLLDMKYNPDYLKIEQNDRPVKTASFLQVKNKIKGNTSTNWSKFIDQMFSSI